MLLVHSTGDKGMAYVETKNLDGETNLKHKIAPKELNMTYNQEEELLKFSSEENHEILNCEIPNNQIYKFNSNMRLSENTLRKSRNLDLNVDVNSTLVLTNENVALRGMSLRNTEYVYGVVVYTGRESKI